MGLKPASLSLSPGGRPRRLQPGPWQGLLVHALHLTDEIRAHGIDNPYWTFGGGTVLMLRYRHRRSKDNEPRGREPNVGPEPEADGNTISPLPSKMRTRCSSASTDTVRCTCVCGTV